MNQGETELVLLTLANPLVWTPLVTATGRCYWLAETEDWRFEVSQRPDLAVEWMARVRGMAWRISVIMKNDSNCANKMGSRIYAPEEAKSVCDRIALTGDFAEFERLEGEHVKEQEALLAREAGKIKGKYTG